MNMRLGLGGERPSEETSWSIGSESTSVVVGSVAALASTVVLAVRAAERGWGPAECRCDGAPQLVSIYGTIGILGQFGPCDRTMRY
jgi:hypothetical protein